MNKKGDLSLSITAIVVIVIAFVVLGLGLSLTRTIFKGAQDKLPEAFAVTNLESEPTAENPITIPQTVEIDRGKSKTMQIGFYNKNQDRVLNAKFKLTECLDKAGVEVLVDKLPSISSTSQDVPASSAAGYSIILNENSLTAETYICTIAVCNDGDCSTPESTYQKDQFFLRVIA
ncbi:MAG: hypothetical protein AABX37_05725 [Nanoarchaeota archaeon]